MITTTSVFTSRWLTFLLVCGKRHPHLGEYGASYDIHTHFISMRERAEQISVGRVSIFVLQVYDSCHRQSKYSVCRVRVSGEIRHQSANRTERCI